MYWLFSGGNYYPAGGMDDYKGSYPTIESAKAEAEIRVSDGDWGNPDWAQIADQHLKVIVVRGSYNWDWTKSQGKDVRVGWEWDDV